MIQETSEGKTYYCKGCEEEARNPNITPPPHTCGKKVNINYTPNQSPKQMHERFDDWKNIVEYFFKFQAVNHYPEDKNKLIENLEPIMKQQTTLAYELGKQEVYSDNGVNDMCEYWHKKGKKEMLEMVVKDIEEIVQYEENRKQGYEHPQWNRAKKDTLVNLLNLKQKLLALNEE